MENNLQKSLEKFTQGSEPVSQEQLGMVKNHLLQVHAGSIKGITGKVFFNYLIAFMVSLLFWHQKGVGIFSVNINQFLTFIPEFIATFLDGLVASGFSFLLMGYLFNPIDKVILKRTFHKYSMYISLVLGFLINLVAGINLLLFPLWVIGSLVGCYFNYLRITKE